RRRAAQLRLRRRQRRLGLLGRADQHQPGRPRGAALPRPPARAGRGVSVGRGSLACRLSVRLSLTVAANAKPPAINTPPSDRPGARRAFPPRIRPRSFPPLPPPPDCLLAIVTLLAIITQRRFPFPRPPRPPEEMARE